MKPLFLAITLATILPAAAFAPRWPAASLTWYTAASAALTAIEEQAAAAYTDPAALPDALDELAAIAADIADLAPPPALLAAQVELDYAARKCAQSLAYEQGKPIDTAAVLLLRTECARSVKDTHAEIARYAATVGGLPAPK